MQDNLFWQQEKRTYWLQLQDKVPHAILISGIKGLGKYKLASFCAQALLCKEKNKPCGQCQSCIQFLHQTHPGLLLLEDKDKSIGIDSIRELQEKLILSCYYTNWKIAIIHDASKLTLAAANGLLKFLEEPPSFTVFFLISNEYSKVLPTIRSRCQHWRLSPPFNAMDWLQQHMATEDFHQAEFLLKLSQGAPLLALEYYQQKETWQELREGFFVALKQWLDNKIILMELIALWQKSPLDFILTSLYYCSVDFLRFYYGCETKMLINIDYKEILITWAQRYSYLQIWYWQQKLLECFKLKERNVQSQLILEQAVFALETGVI